MRGHNRALKLYSVNNGERCISFLKDGDSHWLGRDQASLANSWLIV